MDHIDPLAESCEKDRILKSNIPAADHRRYLFPEERAVAGRAVGNTFSGKFCLAWDPKLSVMRTGSDNDRFRESRLLFSHYLTDHRRMFRSRFCRLQNFVLIRKIRVLNF